MPIALPPALPPVQGSADQIRQQGADYLVAHVNNVSVHVIAPAVLARALLESSIDASASLSDAVRQIQALYYLAGYPAVRVTYALTGTDLYVLVILGGLSRIEAPARYAGYFNPLVRPSAPLTDEMLEPARTLASLHADRAGQTGSASLVQEGDDVALRIEPIDTGPRQSELAANFGNPGNRFIGRYFVDYSAKTSLKSGDELKAGGQNVLPGMSSEDSSADQYREYDLGWSRVTPMGLFDLSGRYIDYRLLLDLPTSSAAPIPVDGQLQQADLSWSRLLSANFFHRWGLSATAEYIRKNLTTPPNATALQRQEYGSIEIASDYAFSISTGGARTDLTVGLALRSGLGEDKTSDPVTRADLGYLLARSTASAKAQLHKNLSVSLVLNAQFSGHTLPEEQQWLLGGVNNIEAYLPGIAAGDSGGSARLQVERTATSLGWFQITPALFTEYGVARYRHPQLGTQQANTQSVADVGASLEFQLGPHIDAALSYAKAFEDANIENSVLKSADAAIFFRVGAKFSY